MKIISIDLSQTWGIKDPTTGLEYPWENDDDDEAPALFHAPLITAVFPHRFPDDSTYTNDEEFSAKWADFYNEYHKRVDEDSAPDKILEKFVSPHFALELTKSGIFGPGLATLYFIIEEKYESQLDSLLQKN